MTTIDADAHVIETPTTWSYMREDEMDVRPQIFIRDTNDGAPVGGNTRREYWVIEDKIQSKGSNVGKDVSKESGTMENIKARVDHMDEIGIDVQVLFPSLFLRPLSVNPRTDLALARSYNRWLIDIWKKAPTRLYWVAVPPLRSLTNPAVVREELEFCKENGARGIFMRGMECNRVLSDSYFDPLYEMAQELDMPITLHAGVDSFTYHDLLQPGEGGLMTFKFPVIGSFSCLLVEEVPQRFPDLRWGFIETSAQWVPYVLGEVKLRMQRKGRRYSDDILTRSNFYITTQRTDDLPWLLDEIGDDNLLVGTDYGHRDTATEVEALKRMSEDESLPQSTVDKILQSNPGRLYAL